MKPRQSPQVRAKLSPTLKSWFPILQSATIDLEEVLEDFVAENPFVEIASNIALPTALTPTKSARRDSAPKRYMSDTIEALSVHEKSLYEILESQILPPLFPTSLSQKIAFEIIEHINSEGYFEGDIDEIARNLGVESALVEGIRRRFSKIDPPGIAAKNSIEAMIFQLDDFDLEGEAWDLCFHIINDLKNHKKHIKNPLYNACMNIIARLKTPPALDFLPKESPKIPDMFILSTDEGFEVSLNDEYYPSIFIDTITSKDAHIRAKLKEARDLIDALNMRKSTIKKIGLMLLEYQYDFFNGGEIKPLKLKDIAGELGHNPSTISRAIANKYLECNRGIYAIKDFFTTAITEETSNTAIKEYIRECVRDENRRNPLSDIKILELIEERFHLKIVRRTITKYRKQLNIASSGERKKLYEMKM